MSADRQRKPAGRAGAERAELCFCNHKRGDHADGSCTHCDCWHYRRRPCTCGHRAELHAAGPCQDPECKCRQFRRDESPEFLLRRGVRAGEWQFISDAQLLYLMRPSQDPTIRVWACGMRCAIGLKKRLAVQKDASGAPKRDKFGKLIPLTPGDIVAMLNALDTIPRMTKQIVRRELEELERQGAARRVGRIRCNVRLFFYFKPLRSRTTNPDLVVCTDYQTSGSASNDETSERAVILRLRKIFVKSFLSALRKDLGDLVVQPDYQKRVEEAVDELAEVVQAAYQNLKLVVCTAPQASDKQQGISELQTGPGASSFPVVKNTLAEQTSSSSSPPIKPTTATPTPTLPEPGPAENTEISAVAESLSRVCTPDDYAVRVLIGRCRMAVSDCTPQEIAHFITEKAGQAKTNPLGFFLQAVPKCFQGQSFQLYRRQCQAEAERAAAVLRRQAEKREARCAEYRATLADPKASEEEKSLVRELLEAETDA